MSSVLDFPSKRLTYAGIGNPVFVDDIANITENLLIAMQTIYGFNNTDFYILSGFDYAANQYAPGICYIKGNFYYSPITIDEGDYLADNQIGSLNKVFSDSSSHPIYDVYYAAPSGVAGFSPQFSGNMNQYRISMKEVVANAANPIDRGQVFAYDFPTAYFTSLGTLDGLPHPINIASLVPATANAKLVHLIFRYESPTTGSTGRFLRNGTFYPLDISASIFTVGSDTTNYHYGDIWVPFDSSQTIWYAIDSTMNHIDLLIAGYM